MELDAVTIAVIAGVLVALVWGFASQQRPSAGRAGVGDGRSRWLGTAAWLGIFGATSQSDGETRGGDDHGIGGDWAGGHGGADYGGGGWGGGDYGGGDGGGGGGD